uniref:Uncharacterized protein MANES_15G021700 n=1 Tax=Rhizophora mucronata TaxID=61149 RepID=A0A2P2MXE0_RHIMU
MGHGKSSETDGSIHLPIVELRRLREAYGSGTTNFEPQSGKEKIYGSRTNSVDPATTTVRAPEKKLTLFALRLAVLEKAATGLGTLGFIWATVVLLGGFAITLDKTDFWFITIILLIEGTRIFSRSHELEWQHQATWSIADAGISSFRALRSSSHFVIKTVKTLVRPISQVRKQSQHTREVSSSCDAANTGNADCQRKQNRTWESSEVPILPYSQWVFASKNVSRLLHWLQIASATACVVLSLTKLIRHNYGEVAKGDSDKRNRKEALNIFYALALAEALLFLMEKAYWDYKVIYRKLLEEVNKECELGPSGLLSIKRFFYDAYSKCVYGSIFDGLKMDIVAFSMDLLASNSPDEQLLGITVLRLFAMNERFSDDTLRKIGTNISVMERLVEMLNWKDPEEKEIRRSAAEMLSKLAGKKQNALRVAGIPGAMESISSLLQTNRIRSATADEIDEEKIICDLPHYDFWTFNHLGLLLLKKLARDHDNCWKIGNTRGLLPKIIDFMHSGEKLLKDKSSATSQILTVKRSLQLVKLLVSTTGNTGKQLRKEISEIVFTVSNIRDILRHGAIQPMLQKHGIEILNSLALEVEARERIGGTGGVLKELFNIFFNQESHDHVRIAAGEALAILALESSSNCHRILKLKVLKGLIAALEVPLLQINAARILRSLCAYSGEDCLNHLKGVTDSAPTALKAVMMSEEDKLQEVMVGLAAEVFKFMTYEESNAIFERAGIKEAALANRVIQILKKYEHPPIKVPRIRRFAIELAIWMMRKNTENVRVFKGLGLDRDLEGVLETTAEVESFNIFSGMVGLSRHSTTVHSLVETALELLAEN